MSLFDMMGGMKDFEKIGKDFVDFKESVDLRLNTILDNQALIMAKLGIETVKEVQNA